MTLAFAVFNAVNMGVWQILGPVIANDTIGVEGWGLVLSARSVGALLASVVMVKLTVRRPMVPALSSMTLDAVPLILLGSGAHILTGCGSIHGRSGLRVLHRCADDRQQHPRSVAVHPGF